MNKGLGDRDAMAEWQLQLCWAQGGARAAIVRSLEPDSERRFVVWPREHAPVWTTDGAEFNQLFTAAADPAAHVTWWEPTAEECETLLRDWRALDGAQLSFGGSGFEGDGRQNGAGAADQETERSLYQAAGPLRPLGVAAEQEDRQGHKEHQDGDQERAASETDAKDLRQAGALHS